MIDFQETKNYLIEKVSGYTHEKALAFRATLPDLNPELIAPIGTFEDYKLPIGNFSFDAFIRCVHNRGDAPYPIWETISNNEFCFYKHNTSVYYRPDDYVCKLSRTHLPHDWKMHKKTYELNQRLQLIDMEEPIHQESMGLNSTTYWFTVVKRPNLWNLVEPHYIHNNKEFTVDNFKQIIDYISNYVELMKQLYDIDTTGLPSNGALISLCRAYPDWKINGLKGIFVDFKRYELSFTKFLQQTYAGIWDYFTVHPWDPNMSQTTKREMLDYALNIFSSRFSYDRDIIAIVERPDRGGIVIS